MELTNYISDMVVTFETNSWVTTSMTNRNKKHLTGNNNAKKLKMA